MQVIYDSNYLFIEPLLYYDLTCMLKPENYNLSAVIPFSAKVRRFSTVLFFITLR